MSVYLEKCGNALCERLYEVERFSQEFLVREASSTPACPYCGFLAKSIAGRAYRTRPLAEEYEMWPESAAFPSGFVGTMRSVEVRRKNPTRRGPDGINSQGEETVG